MYRAQFNAYCAWMLNVVTTGALLIMCSFIFLKLSVMQTEGFLPAGATVAGIFFAICSIMYGRATLKFSDQEKKKMAIQAAEDSFMGTLLALMYFATSSIVFFVLNQSGRYPPVVGDISLYNWLPLPTVLAAILYLVLAAPACVKLMLAIEVTGNSWVERPRT